MTSDLSTFNFHTDYAVSARRMRDGGTGGATLINQSAEKKNSPATVHRAHYGEQRDYKKNNWDLDLVI